MAHPNTNRYRSGAKNPHRQILVSELDDGGYAVTVYDTKNFRLVHNVIGKGLTEEEISDKIRGQS